MINCQTTEAADKYAEDTLIPPQEYQMFVRQNKFDNMSIIRFANQIDRDPGIVLGRLLNDGKVEYSDWGLKSLRKHIK